MLSQCAFLSVSLIKRRRREGNKQMKPVSCSLWRSWKVWGAEHWHRQEGKPQNCTVLHLVPVGWRLDLRLTALGSRRQKVNMIHWRDRTDHITVLTDAACVHEMVGHRKDTHVLTSAHTSVVLHCTCSSLHNMGIYKRTDWKAQCLPSSPSVIV